MDLSRHSPREVSQVLGHTRGLTCIRWADLPHKYDCNFSGFGVQKGMAHWPDALVPDKVALRLEILAGGLETPRSQCLTCFGSQG
jgi:hypothetical protein